MLQLAESKHNAADRSTTRHSIQSPLWPVATKLIHKRSPVGFPETFFQSHRGLHASQSSARWRAQEYFLVANSYLFVFLSPRSNVARYANVRHGGSSFRRSSCFAQSCRLRRAEFVCHAAAAVAIDGSPAKSPVRSPESSEFRCSPVEVHDGMTLVCPLAASKRTRTKRMSVLATAVDGQCS